MRHVGTRRPAGRRQRRADRGARRGRRRAPAARCARDAHGRRRSAATATRVAGVTLADGTEITASIVVSACDPHARSSSGCATRRRQAAATDRPLARRAAAPTGYESKIDAVLDRAPAPARQRAPACRRRSRVAPTVAEMDRAAAMLATGEVLERPALLVNVPSIADPTMAPAGPPRAQPRGAAHAVRACPGGWAGSPEPRRWLELFADALRARASSSRSSTGGR